MQSMIYAVYDRKAQAYGKPFLMHNSAMASRAFLHACNDPTTDVGMCPTDYSLRLIGSYDDEDGKITPCEPAIICEGVPVQQIGADDPTNTERN